MGLIYVYQRVRSQLGSESSFYWSAADLNEDFLDLIERRRDRTPVFGWDHYMDNHRPYEPPTEYLERRPFRGVWTWGKLGEFSRKSFKSKGEDMDDDRHDLECAKEPT